MTFSNGAYGDYPFSSEADSSEFLIFTGFENSNEFGSFGAETNVIQFNSFENINEFGSVNILKEYDLIFTGYENTNEFGSINLVESLNLTGLENINEFGSFSVLKEKDVLFTGFENTNEFGVHYLTESIYLTGFENTNEFGTLNIRISSNFTGFENTNEFGNNRIDLGILFTGFENTNEFGSPTAIQLLDELFFTGFENQNQFGSQLFTPYFDTIIDPENDNLVFSILNGFLPPGLQLRYDGKLLGVLENFPSLGGVEGSFYRDYYFTVRATDGGFETDKSFAVRVYRTLGSNQPPVWETKPWFENSIGTYFQGRFIDYTLQVDDTLPLTFYEVQLTDFGIPEETSNVFHELPFGLSITTDGHIIGTIDIQTPPGEYYFQVEVSNGLISVPMAFKINVAEIPIFINPSEFPISSIIWETLPGLLGVLNELESSYLSVSAKSSSNRIIHYQLSSSSDPLPDGLILDIETGEIRGKANYISTDTEYSFIVQAFYADDPTEYEEREFSIIIKDVFDQPISSVEFMISGFDKIDWMTWITNIGFSDSYIKNEYIYKLYKYYYENKFDLLDFFNSNSDCNIFLDEFIKRQDLFYNKKDEKITKNDKIKYWFKSKINKIIFNDEINKSLLKQINYYINKHIQNSYKKFYKLYLKI